MKKRLLAGLTAVLMCMFPAWCCAKEERQTFQSGEWEYYLNEDNTVTISHWSGDAQSLVIPGEIDGGQVTGIGEGAFLTCSGLKEVVIPDSVTEIEKHAFDQCSRLTGITIPDGVKLIGDYAFWLCGNLKELTIPDSVTRIGKMAFTACALTQVSIPESVEEIGDWAFGSCHYLTDIEVSPENKHFAVMNNALVETQTMTIICYPEGLDDPEYVIPEGITGIGTSAFSFCDSLERITIPEGVTVIGTHAFSSCRSLTDINIPDSVGKIGPCAFLNCKKLTFLEVPESVTEIGNGAFEDCNVLTLAVTEGSYAAQYAKENTVPYRDH